MEMLTGAIYQPLHPVTFDNSRPFPRGRVSSYPGSCTRHRKPRQSAGNAQDCLPTDGQPTWDLIEKKMIQTREAWNYPPLNKISSALCLFLLALFLAPLATAKKSVDFDPILDFSKYKTFSYIGGVNTLELRQLTPDYTTNNVHAGAAQALISRGQRETSPAH